MLVLAIIVIAAGLSIPMMQAMLDDARETAAGDMIRGKAAETRAHAMETGKAWRFAYLPGTGVIQIAPDDSDDWNSTGDHTPIEKEDLIRDEMPKDIVWDQPDAADANPPAIRVADSEFAAGGRAGAPPGTDSWQTIAVYLYDGCVRDDANTPTLTTYFGKAGTSPMALQIRVFTGSAAILSPKEMMDSQP